MNKGYTIKDSKAIITDTKGNLKEIEYYDRLDETLVQENIVEAMENVISKLNDYTSMQEVLAEKIVLEELGVGCQWPIGSIAQIKNKKFHIYSILLTQDGEILKEQSETGSIKDAIELGTKIGRVFGDYV